MCIFHPVNKFEILNIHPFIYTAKYQKKKTKKLLILQNELTLTKKDYFHCLQELTFYTQVIAYTSQTQSTSPRLIKEEDRQ